MTLKARVIPCLDVKDGRVVKGVNFVDLIDAGDPVEAAKAYDAAGADELCFLDITASSDNRDTIFDVVARTAEHCFMPLTVGGGVRAHRRHPQAAAGRRRQGVDQLGGGARIPISCAEAADKFGNQCIVVSIDSKKVSRGGRGRPLGDLHPWRPQADRHRCGRTSPTKMVERGAGELLLTSMDRDGQQGRLRHRADAHDRRLRCRVPVIASGGVGTLDHLVDGIRDGHATAVLAASIFHFGTYTIGEAKRYMAESRHRQCGSTG